MDGEIEALDSCTAQVLEFEDDIAVRAHMAFLVVLVELATHNMLDELVLRQSFHGPSDDVLAVTENGHRISHLEDLVEVVRDEQDSHTAVGDTAHERVQPLGLGAGEVRGGLVEDEHLRRCTAGRHRSGNGHCGALTHREASDRHANIDVVAEGHEGFVRRRALLLPADGLRDAGDVALTDREVVDDVEVADESEILVHEAKADRFTRGRIGEREFLAIDGHLGAGLWFVEPGEDLDEGRLAAAVLPDQRAHLARRDVNAHVVECNLATEDLRCLANRKRGRH